MKKLRESELQKLLWDRPKLKERLDLYEVREVYTLTEAPTHREEDIWGRKNALILAVGKKNNYLMMDTAGTKAHPEDKLKVWLANNMPITEAPQASQDYVVIERAKMGRPKRELTEQERQEILRLHSVEKMGINRIAQKMNLGTKRITMIIKQENQKDGHEVEKERDSG